MGIFEKFRSSVKQNKIVATTAKIGSSIYFLKEKFKGETDDAKALKIPSVGMKNAVEHPYDFSYTLKLYKTFGPVTAIVDKYVDFIVGSGFTIKASDPRLQTIIENFIKEHNFDSLLRHWIKTALLTGNGYIEIAGGKGNVPDEMKVLSPRHMYVARDKTGEIEKYYQYNPQARLRDKKEIPFNIHEIAHLKINSIGDDAYGIGVIFPLIKIIGAFIKANKDMHKILSRKANSQVHVKMGLGDHGVFPTEGDVSAFGKKLEYMNERTEWVTGPDVEMNVLNYGNIGEKFKEVLEHDLELISISSQVPEVLLGYGNIPEGLAQEQKYAFELRAKSFQIEIEKVIETEILSRVIATSGIQGTVEFEWGEPNIKEVNEEVIRITELLKIILLSDDLRFELEERLKQLMKLDTKESPEKEKNREDKEKLPKVPEQIPKNNPVRKFPTESGEDLKEYGCYCDVNEDLHKDYTIKEWVGFDYQDYKSFILSAVRGHSFTELIAKDQYDEAIGKLSPEKTEKLREILSEGFEKEQSVNQIAKNIKVRVEPPNLYAVDEKGKIKYKSDGVTPVLRASSRLRPYTIARTETVRLAVEGSLKNYKANDIERVRWAAAVSERTCPVCTGNDGIVMTIDEASAQIPAHVACRCTFIPVIETTEKVKKPCKKKK